jgi:hypothetical protein
MGKNTKQPPELSNQFQYRVTTLLFKKATVDKYYKSITFFVHYFDNRLNNLHHS